MRKIVLVIFVMVSVVNVSSDSFFESKSEEEQLIEQIQNTALTRWPNQPIGQAFSDTFFDESWEYYEREGSRDHIHYVLYRAKDEYRGRETDVTIRFRYNERSRQFEIQRLRWAGIWTGPGLDNTALYYDVLERIFR